jgi:hypothetical protein
MTRYVGDSTATIVMASWATLSPKRTSWWSSTTAASVAIALASPSSPTPWARRTKDHKARIGAASKFARPQILVPASNTEVFGWCMDRGIELVQLVTLMTAGM